MSEAQRRDALRRANEVRTRRARLKRDLRAGRASIDRLLQDPPDYLQTAKVADVLMALTRFGQVRIATALKECGISPAATFGALTERQRRELASYLRKRRG